MNALIRLLKNTIYLTVANVISPLVSFILVIYISRTLGTRGIGEYTAVITFTFFFEIVAKLGLHNLIVRDIAGDNSRGGAYLTASILIGVTSSLVAWFALHAVLGAMHYPKSIGFAIKVLSLSLIFSVLTKFWQSFFQGLQRMGFSSVVSIAEVAGRVILGIVVIHLGHGILGLIWAILATRALVCLFGFYLVIRLGIRPIWKVDFPLCLKLLKQTVTFLLISLIATTYWKMDVVMLSKMKGAVAVGFYSAAYRLMEILKGLSYCYIAALFPMISWSYAVSRESFERDCVLSVRYLFMLTFPISIGTSILAGNIITLIYGEEFLPSAGVLQILIWTICFYPIALVFARALVASQNQRFDLLSNIMGMSFNVVLNLLLIPRFSYVGAAVSTLASICFLILIEYFFFSRILLKLSFSKLLVKPVLAACVMGIFTFLLRNSNLFIVVASSACLYVMILFMIRTFSGEEIRALRELWNKKALLLSIHS